MRTTLAAFGALALASALPAPLDLAAGLLTLLGLLATDRATWARHVAAFAWMCSRIWPAWIHDPYRLSDLVVLALGLGTLLEHLRPLPSVSLPARRAAELALALAALMPAHGAPHPLLAAAFSAACVVVWRASEDRHPGLLLKTCVWILCLRTPALALAPAAVAVWALRRHLASPRAALPEPPAAPKAPQAPPKAHRAPAPVVIRSARVPPEFHSRGAPVAAARRQEADEAELSRYEPIASDEV